MLDTTNSPPSSKLRLHDVSDVLSILARAQRWTAYFALLARCAPETAPECDPRKRQWIAVVDVSSGEAK